MNNKKQKHKQLTIITIIFSIISLVFLSTIAYSAFSSTMNITGMAHARVEANVRITDFKLESTNNATSSYEEFGKEHISTAITFEENAYAIYKVEVTNYGETNVGIYSITGLPENVTYELIDYNLKDKICNINGKCNSFASKTFYIKFTGTNIETEFTLNFKFKIFHNFTYVDFNNTYISGVLDSESTTIDLSKDSPKMVSVVSDKYIDYTYINNILTLNNVTSDVKISAVTNTEYIFDYTGAYQTFSVPYEGIYKIELWGAQGGGDENYPGGKGGYTKGTIPLNEKTNLYLYVGSYGGEDSAIFNNGHRCIYQDNEYGTGYLYSGGGSTDIRLSSGQWNDFESLKSRIMVAGAGGGTTTYYSNLLGGAGGGLIGYDGEIGGSGNNIITATGASQISGGLNGSSNSSNTLSEKGAFGTPYATTSFYSGGGNGYYAGGHGGHGSGIIGSGAGGSSFISGHDGCNAIGESSTESNIVHTNQSIHYSNYKFTDTVMIDGEGYNWTTEKGSSVVGMSTHDGTSTMTGNEGNGYAKITLLNTQIEYNIVYSNISGNYQSKVKKGANLVVNFGSNAPDEITVLLNGTKNSNYTYTNGTLTILNVSSDIEIVKKTSYNFDYTGSVQEFKVPYNGVYKVELWGAQGGNIGGTGYDENDNVVIENVEYKGGLGGYTSGKINLTSGTKLYLYVGGTIPQTNTTLVGGTTVGGWNGGGFIRADQGNLGVGGGGATDIRLVGGATDDFSSLMSRIMVAGAGGGANFRNQMYGEGNGGQGGGLIGYTGHVAKNRYGRADHPTGYNPGSGGTQTEGGRSEAHCLDGTIIISTPKGGFGKPLADFQTEQSGGGAGYYNGSYSGHAGAGGGSSFISGHNGCDAITESSTESNIVHTGQSIHYSGYKFTDTVMIDGAGYNWTTEKGTEVIGMPTYDGTSTMIGNEGNGYAKISLIEIN